MLLSSANLVMRVLSSDVNILLRAAVRDMGRKFLGLSLDSFL